MIRRLTAINGTTWHAQLDPESVRLFGIPVAIEIETRSNPRETPVPKMSEAEALLITSVLDNIHTVLAECGRMLKTDPSVEHAERTDDVTFSNPHVWISRETIDQEGAARWAFVLGIDANPNFGWHVEFDGLKGLEVWAGD